MSIEAQGFMKETIDTLLWLNLEFWCTNQEEKDLLKKMYDNNQKILEEEKREKYNPDNIFTPSSTKELTVKKETNNIFYRIIQKIKNIFKKDKIQDEM